MSVWSGKEISEYIEPIDKKQIQPNGVDLRVGKILKNTERGVLGESRREIPHRDAGSDVGKVYSADGELLEYNLDSSSYIVVYNEKIKIPENAVGIVYPRSSLMRMGARLHSAVWDSGYEGKGEGLLVVHNRNGISIEPNARIGQMIFIESRSSSQYEGKYQNERLSRGSEISDEEGNVH